MDANSYCDQRRICLLAQAGGCQGCWQASQMIALLLFRKRQLAQFHLLSGFGPPAATTNLKYPATKATQAQEPGRASQNLASPGGTKAGARNRKKIQPATAMAPAINGDAPRPLASAA